MALCAARRGNPGCPTHWSSSLFWLQKKRKNDTHGNPCIINSCSQELWSSYTSPLKASSSWPRVNIPWRPWSPAPCSRRWWSFHLHAFCWMSLPSCVFQIWVCTQAHNMMCHSDWYLMCIQQKTVTFISAFYFDCSDCFLIDSFSAQMLFLHWNHHLTQSSRGVGTYKSTQWKVQVIYFGTKHKDHQENRAKEEGEKVAWEEVD